MIEANTSELLRKIRELEDEVLGDLKPYWDDYASELVRTEVARTFASEGWGQWRALSPVYAEMKRKIAPFKTILRLTDRYFKASSIKGEAGNVYVAGKDNMVWGIDINAFEDPYPLRHELGSGRLPRRPVWSNPIFLERLKGAIELSLKRYLSVSLAKGD